MVRRPHPSKGLRHGFGVAAVTHLPHTQRPDTLAVADRPSELSRYTAGIPLNLVQKWLGHAQLTTTAIYADAIGAEEKDIARRMWG
jgi:integrase/recombinase XerD